jgi:pyruvate dehydrogenase E1 component alpha subunit
LSLVADVVEVMRAEDPVRRLFAPDGTLSDEARQSLRLDPEAMRNLYRWMVVIRRADQEALNLQRQGQLGLWGQFLGQEAVHVGATLALRETDWIFPSYREFGMAMCRGVDPAAMLTLFKGLTHGAWDPQRYHFAPLAIPVATQIPHAVGFAMGCRLKKTDEAVLVTFGDGATSEGDWHEAMNFAGVFRSPVVFLCQNNYWAISVPLNRQTAGSIAERAPGYGFPGIRIDGNDILAVYGAVKVAADRARSGEGPYLIEAVTYRMGAHTSSDDPTRYRLAADVDAWSAKDPIARFKKTLASGGMLDEAADRAVIEEAEAIAREMREKLLKAAMPPAGEAVYGGVYQSPPEPFIKEREEFEASLEQP